MNDRYDIIAGLVVDMTTGGIGFRNHTIPSDSGDGAEWDEDLLWIEPETACVNTNLTVDFAITGINREEPFLLTDRGGFTNLAREDPLLDRTDPAQPELWKRAYRGATLSNTNLMGYYNETHEKTRLGKSYNLGTMTQIQANRIGLIDFIDTGPQLPGVPLDPNIKLNVNGTSEWLKPGSATRGFVSSDIANISNIAIQTGMLLGAASRVGGDGPLRLDPGTNWSSPLFVCASSVRASVKTVSFRINGTSLLSHLFVTNITSKMYPNEASKPLWAVEDTGMEIRDVAPSWGIVADRYENAPALWTRRADKLYLPAGAGHQAYLNDDHGEAGAIAPQAALSVTYSDASVLSTVTGMLDYSGYTNYPMFLKWEHLSKSATTAPQIINLIWTDIMANFVMGARSHLSRGRVGTPDAESANVSVITFKRRIRYDLRYAIPALVFLVVYLIGLASSMLLLVSRRAGFGLLRRLLNQTAVGRAVTMDRNPDKLPRDVKTKIWIQVMGGEDIGIRKRYAVGPASEYGKPDEIPSPSMETITDGGDESPIQEKRESKIEVTEI
ncbi:MAG: hypothetical protein M1816_005367 [Peltula sp. TS41687]|nr:MAG: hypothetical protein M1816_005367 [Peltula sp. TS41687]